MARVPIPNGNAVARRPMSDARFRPADNGGGVLGAIGSGMQQLGGALAQHAEVMERVEGERVEAAGKTYDNDFVAGAQAIRSNVMTQTGLNAATARTEANKALTSLRTDILGKAKADRRLTALLTPILDQRMTSLSGEFDAHAQQQTFVANDEASVARIGLAREDAAATLDPATRTKAIQTGLGEIAGRAQAKGLPQDWVAAEGLKFESGVHRAVVDRMLTADDIDAAVAYRDANKDRINGADEAAIDAGLHDPLQRRETTSYVDGIMGSATAGERSAPFTYADPLHGVGRKPVPGGRFNAARDYGSHHGIDIPAPMNAPVYATGAGVARTSKSPLGGNIVTVTHDDGSVSRYMHLGKFSVKDGDRVGPDTAIGVVGVTGRSSGPHLHFEMLKDGKPVDPGKAIGTVSQAPQRHDLNRLLASVDADRAAGRITPEQADRAKTMIDSRVGRDETLLRRTEDEAQRLALDAITRIGPDKFTDISQLPANVRGALGSDDRLRLIEMATSNARALVTGSGVKANGVDAFNLNMMAIYQPQQFAKLNLGMFQGKVTNGELETLARLQAGQRTGAPIATEHSKVWGVINQYGDSIEVDGSNKRRDESQDAFVTRRQKAMSLFSAIKADLDAQLGGKRQPTDDEVKRSFDTAVRQVVRDGDRSNPIRAFEVGGPAQGVPNVVRSRIVDNWRQRYRRQPTEGQIASEYQRYRGREGFWN